jgi:hypothetical protein
MRHGPGRRKLRRACPDRSSTRSARRSTQGPSAFRRTWRRGRRSSVSRSRMPCESCARAGRSSGILFVGAFCWGARRLGGASPVGGRVLFGGAIDVGGTPTRLHVVVGYASCRSASPRRTPQIRMSETTRHSRGGGYAPPSERTECPERHTPERDDDDASRTPRRLVQIEGVPTIETPDGAEAMIAGRSRWRRTTPCWRSSTPSRRPSPTPCGFRPRADARPGRPARLHCRSSPRVRRWQTGTRRGRRSLPGS